MKNSKLFKEASINERLDIAEFALTLAIIDREPWAIKYMLSTQGQKRGYVEALRVSAQIEETVVNITDDRTIEERMKELGIPIPATGGEDLDE